MRWKGREWSGNVEDRRGRSPKQLAVGGGGIVVILIALVASYFGLDPNAVQGILNQVAQPPAANQQAGGAGKNDEAAEFISVVLRDTEQVWTKLFRDNVRGGGYKQPKLVIYTKLDQTGGCGPAKSEFGPFYCPADETIYIDPSFFEDLRQRHRAPGDFAQAYVIAHEVAHHVQLLTGFSQQVRTIRAGGNKTETNRASVRLELQADYLAGVWAHHAQKQFNILQDGDIREAIVAANQIGDDTLMRDAGIKVLPNRFTHGTSQQRVRWFSKGLKSGEFSGLKQLFQINYEDL